MSDPAAPLFHVDSPANWRPTGAGIEVVGWLYPGETALCVDIRARVDKRATLGIYGLERPDTQSAFGGSLGPSQWGQVEYIAMEAPLLAPAVFGHMTAERFRPAHVQVLRQPGVAGLGGLLEVGRQGHFPGCGLAIRP